MAFSSEKRFKKDFVEFRLERRGVSILAPWSVTRCLPFLSLTLAQAQGDACWGIKTRPSKILFHLLVEALSPEICFRLSGRYTAEQEQGDKVRDSH